MSIIDPMFSRPSRGPLEVSSRTRICRAHSGSPFLDILLGIGLDQHPHNVALFHDEVLDVIDFDLGAGPFAHPRRRGD